MDISLISATVWAGLVVVGLACSSPIMDYVLSFVPESSRRAAVTLFSFGLCICCAVTVTWGLGRAAREPVSSLSAEDYQQFADLLAASGRQEEAIAFYKQAIALEETDYSSLVSMLRLEGDRLRELGQPLRSMDRYKLALIVEAEGLEISSRFDAVAHDLDLSSESLVSVFFINADARKVWTAHPPSKAIASLTVPLSATLDFGLALSPEVWQLGKGDGVQFDVYSEDGQHKWHLFSEYIDPKNVVAHRRWHDREIDLSPWVGQTVTITFATGPGPNGDDRYDWAGWGEPRIVQPIAYDFLGELSSADLGRASEKQIRPGQLAINYEPRSIIFQNPTSRIAYHVAVPEQAGLHFGLGMDPTVWDPVKGDGVEYNIYVRDPDHPSVFRRVFSRYLDPKNNPDDRHWIDELVDLSAFGRQTVEIIFETRPGPAGDANYDWAAWSTPVLVADDMALLNPSVEVAVQVEENAK
jgi:tetratricopeptide (TPR) repeat protein